MNKLQMVQNSAARLIARQQKHHHITPVLIGLHWLPVLWRVQYKLLVLVFTALHGPAPGYIRDLITPYLATRNLRSADLHLLVVPRYNLEGYDKRAFSVSGPTLGNSLPENLRQTDNLTSSRLFLKLIYLSWFTSTDKLGFKNFFYGHIFLSIYSCIYYFIYFN